MPVLSPSQTAEEAENDFSSRISRLQKQVLQMIGQHLCDLGLSKSVEALVNETNIKFETNEACVLRSHIVNGEWQMAIDSLSDLKKSLLNKETANEDMQIIEWLILEEEIKELCRCGKVEHAIVKLRQLRKVEIPGVHDKLLKLVWYLVSKLDTCPAKNKEDSSEGRQNLLLAVQKYFPPEIMLPPSRLQTLIAQAAIHQHHNCVFHLNNWKPEISPVDIRLKNIECESLLVDHKCDRATFPTLISQRIEEHCDEVWFCKFSHSGSMLCSSSKDGKVIIWKVIKDTHRLYKHKSCSSEGVGIASISWSPDDTMILCTGAETCKEAFVWKVDSGELVKKFSKGNDDRITTGSWYKDSKRFVVGGLTGKLFCHNIDTGHTTEWEGVRVQCLHVLKDDTILVADNMKRIREFRFDTMKSSELLTEENGIITFIVNRFEDTILVNVVGQGIHLWDLKSRNLIGRYRGILQGSFINHSTFGGECCQFFANGNDKGNLSIWRNSADKPICVLRGHTNTVNCVAWNPTLSTMIVSSGDDKCLVCWAPQRFALHPQPNIQEESDLDRAAHLMPDGRPM